MIHSTMLVIEFMLLNLLQLPPLVICILQNDTYYFMILFYCFKELRPMLVSVTDLTVLMERYVTL